MFRGEEPGLAGPARGAGTGGDAAQGKDVADDLIEALFEDAGEAGAFEWIFEFGIEWIDIDGELALLPHVVEDVFES